MIKEQEAVTLTPQKSEQLTLNIHELVTLALALAHTITLGKGEVAPFRRISLHQRLSPISFQELSGEEKDE